MTRAHPGSHSGCDTREPCDCGPDVSPTHRAKLTREGDRTRHVCLRGLRAGPGHRDPLSLPMSAALVQRGGLALATSPAQLALPRPQRGGAERHSSCHRSDAARGRLRAGPVS